MNKCFLAIGSACLMTACGTLGPGLTDCEGLGFPKSVTLRYGEEGITVQPKTVKRQTPFTIKLKPSSNDYKDKVVTIDGKNAVPGGGPSADWLDTSDDYNTRKKFIFCTPNVEPGGDQSYFYSVEVESIGEIDPRVDVVH